MCSPVEVLLSGHPDKGEDTEQVTHQPQAPHSYLHTTQLQLFHFNTWLVLCNKFMKGYIMKLEGYEGYRNLYSQLPWPDIELKEKNVSF